MMEGMSAANATDDNRDAAPAAMRNLTLRIGFVLLAGEADKAPLLKLTGGRWHQIIKRRLTLIFKVVILGGFFASDVCGARAGAFAPQMPRRKWRKPPYILTMC